MGAPVAGQARQGRRGGDRNDGVRPAAVAGPPDSTRAVHVPGLREHHSVTGAVPRDYARPELLAMNLEAEFGQHLPRSRENQTSARNGMGLNVSSIQVLVMSADFTCMAKSLQKRSPREASRGDLFAHHHRQDARHRHSRLASGRPVADRRPSRVTPARPSALECRTAQNNTIA